MPRMIASSKFPNMSPLSLNGSITKGAKGKGSTSIDGMDRGIACQEWQARPHHPIAHRSHPRATNRISIATLGPVRLRILRSGLGLRCRVDRDQIAFLPLEQVARSQNILSRSVKLHRPLHGLEGITRVKFRNQLRIIDAVDFGRRLLEHLPDRESLGHVGTNAAG